MFRKIISTAALLLPVCLFAENRIFFCPSWIDGRATAAEEPTCIVSTSSANTDNFIYYTAGGTYTFKAIVPKGHDVTKWSYDAYSSTKVINARYSGSFQNVRTTSPVDTFVWTSIPSGGQSLAVHLDWLKYTISYEGNGATGGSAGSHSDIVYTNSFALIANPFVKTGYRFLEWAQKDSPSTRLADGANVTGEDFDGLAYTNKAVTLIAQWEAKTYDVTFNANGGKFSDEATERTLPVVYDQKYGELPTDVSLFSYQFDGWTNAAGVVISSDTVLKTATNHTLYAKWTWVPQQHTVTFDPGLVVATPSFSSKTVTYTMAYGDLPTIAAEGYEFQGWYTKKTGGTEVTKYSTVTTDDDHVLYAHWLAETYKLVYKPLGGSVKIGWETVTFGEYYPKLETPTRQGYTFGGWFTEPDGGDKVEEGDRVTIVSDTDIYARWTANGYTVTFDANGGTGEPMAALSLKYDIVTNLPPCTYVNGDRSFVGWIGSDSRTFENLAAVSNLTAAAGGVYALTACWSDDYVIVFDGNGATNAVMQNQRLLTTETASLSSNLYERTGYTYRGWATNAQDAAAQKIRFADGELVKGVGKAGETVRLYAVWTNNPYRVRFYPNGGDGAPFERTFVYDVAQELPGSDAFEKSGYVLTGWLTDPTNAVHLAEGSSVSNLTATAGETVSLFAKWAIDAPELSDLAVAADSNFNLTADPSAWCTVINGDKGCLTGNDQCIEMSPQADDNQVTLQLLIKGSGKLAFYYKRDAVSELGLDENTRFDVNVDGTNVVSKITGPCSEWLRTEYAISDVRSSVELLVYTKYAGYQYSVRLDGISWVPDRATVGVTFRLNDGTLAPADIVTNMTCEAGKAIGTLPILSGDGFDGWSTNGTAVGKIDASWIIPAADTQLFAVWDSGEHPVPGTGDAPTIGGFAPSESGFALSFVSDARFDYRLLSTLTLTPPNWQPTQGVDVKPGTGEVLTFEIDAGREGTPGTEFFKVEVLQRVE